MLLLFGFTWGKKRKEKRNLTVLSNIVQDCHLTDKLSQFSEHLNLPPVLIALKSSPGLPSGLYYPEHHYVVA